ncbi:MAG: class I SAM-dependent methyltransferase [Ignisphaera sp.]
MSKRSEEIVRNYFIDKGPLFKIIMDSKPMILRAKKLAKGIAKQLIFMGIEKGIILDIGCGTGRIALELAEIGYNVVGIDISPIYIDEAIRRAKERKLIDKVEFILCDARELTKCVGDRKYDAALFVWSSVIGYYDEDTDIDVLLQVRNVTKDNGVLLFVDFVNRDYTAMEFTFLGTKTITYDYENYVVLETTIFNPVTSEILIKQLFYRKEGRNLVYVDELYFRMKVYSLSELVNLAKRSGWCLNRVLKEIGGEPGYDFMKPLNLMFTPCKT